MKRKRTLGLMLAGMLVTCTAQAAETEDAFTVPAYDYEVLTVGVTTPFAGNFFTSQFGNVSSDLDVRTLIHGYDLVEWRSEDSSFGLDPSVVSAVTVSETEEGDRVYQLTLYDDLYYSDGTKITAWDYAFSALLAISPTLNELGGAPKDGSYLAGYEAYESGQTQALAGIRVTGEDLITFTVSHAYLPFFYELALLDCTPYPIGEIAPGCEVRDDGEGVYIANADPREETPLFTASLLRETLLDPEEGYLSHPAVTSGPYTLVSFDGDQVELARNPHYKGNAEGLVPSIETIRYQTVENDTMVQAFAQGEITLLSRVVSLSALEELMPLVRQHSDVWSMSNYPRSGLSFISFCCEKLPVSDEQVRQAIAMCLDKDALVEQYVGSYGLRVDGYYGLGQWMNMVIGGTLRAPVEEPEAGDEAAQVAYEQALEEWGALSLENVQVYDLDVEAAVVLLEEDGWIWNKEGEAYDPQRDRVRCKEVIRADGSREMAALELTLAVPEGNAIAQALEEALTRNLAQAGILLQVRTLPMQELLDAYYSSGERDVDMIYLASNFDVVFDPALTFRPLGDDPEQETQTRNATHVEDERLYELAVDMRMTEPGDTLSYLRKWVAFQEQFSQTLPLIPVYSNVYFDFYPRVLHDYEVEKYISWGPAAVKAYLSDAAPDGSAPE